MEEKLSTFSNGILMNMVDSAVEFGVVSNVRRRVNLILVN